MDHQYKLQVNPGEIKVIGPNGPMLYAHASQLADGPWIVDVRYESWSHQLGAPARGERLLRRWMKPVILARCKMLGITLPRGWLGTLFTGHSKQWRKNWK